MLVIGRLDDTGPTALKGSLAIYPWGVAPGWYEPGPSALLKGAHQLQSWRLRHRGSGARQGKTARRCVFPDGIGPACGTARDACRSRSSSPSTPHTWRRSRYGVHAGTAAFADPKRFIEPQQTDVPGKMPGTHHCIGERRPLACRSRRLAGDSSFTGATFPDSNGGTAPSNALIEEPLNRSPSAQPLLPGGPPPPPASAPRSPAWQAPHSNPPPPSPHPSSRGSMKDTPSASRKGRCP